MAIIVLLSIFAGLAAPKGLLGQSASGAIVGNQRESTPSAQAAVAVTGSNEACAAGATE